MSISRDEYHAELASAMTERALQDGVATIVRDINRTTPGALLYYHTHRSQHSPAGFPDVVILSPIHGTRLVAELKRERKSAKPTDPQVEWLDAFGTCGDDVYLWRPRHLLSGEIERLIRCVADGLNLEMIVTESEWRGYE